MLLKSKAKFLKLKRKKSLLKHKTDDGGKTNTADQSKEKTLIRPPHQSSKSKIHCGMEEHDTKSTIAGNLARSLLPRRQSVEFLSSFLGKSLIVPLRQEECKVKIGMPNFERITINQEERERLLRRASIDDSQVQQRAGTLDTVIKSREHAVRLIRMAEAGGDIPLDGFHNFDNEDDPTLSSVIRRRHSAITDRLHQSPTDANNPISNIYICR